MNGIYKLHTGEQNYPKISCKVNLLLGDNSRIRHTYQDTVKSISGFINCRQASFFLGFGCIDALRDHTFSPVARISVCFCGNRFPQTVTSVCVFTGVL